jgi:hypothetical protein
MYYKIKNVSSSKVHLAKDVPEKNVGSHGMVSDAHVFTLARFHPEPDTTDVVDAPKFTSGNEKKCVKVKKRLNI